MSREFRSRRIATRVSAVLLAAAAPVLAADKSWMVGNGVWGTAGNWNPVGAPTPVDNAFIGNSFAATNATVSLGGNASALNLIISDGMTLRTQLFTPTIGGHTAVTGFNDPAGPDMFRSTLLVDNGNNDVDFQTNSITVADGATVQLANGSRMAANGLFELDSGTTLTGNGTIELFSNAAGPAMVVNGQITPNSGGWLQIFQNGTARIDLDGNLEADQTINVTGTTGFSFSGFKIDGTGLNDAFGDRLLIGRGNSVNMLLSEGWTLSQFGELEFAHHAGRTDMAQLTGGTFTVNGHISVDADGAGIINSDSIVNTTATIDVGANGSLIFNQPTVINGGEFNIANGANLGFNAPISINAGTFNAIGTGDVTLTGATTYGGNVHFNGVTRQINTATVSSATTINATTFDMDGVGFADWVVNAPFTMNANQIDFAAGAFSGTMTVNATNPFNPNYIDMNVQTPGGWAIDGTLNVVGPGGGVVHSNAIRGSDLSIEGQMNVTGGIASTARMNFASDGTVNINAGGGLRLDGGSLATPNTIAGGHIGGAGSLRALSGHALVGNGTITATVDFDGDAELRASGGFLNIDGPLVDVGVIGTADATGILDVDGPWNTGVAERVELLGGQLRGGMLFNERQVTGHGLIFVDSVFNEGSFSAVGGELIVNSSTNSIDLDGLGETGRLFVEQGDLTIADLPSDTFSGRAYVGAGRTLDLVSGWLIGSAGTVELTGSVGSPATVTSASGNAQTVLGATVVNGNGVYDLYTGFNSSSRVFTSAAGDTLTLTRGAIVAEGATFSGPGSIVNASTGSLLLDADSTVGMRLANQGLLRIEGDAATGIANAQRFAQSTSGTTRIKVGGTTPGAQFDRLEVTQDAQLTGALELSTLGLYVPQYLQSHEIMRADSVTGFFSTVPNNKIAADKYWAVTYDADSVFATAALPGDANLDGSVNITDFAILASQFNTAGPWVEGNFNGDTTADINDFALLAANFNVSVAAEIPRGAAVPEPTWIAYSLLPVAMITRRKRRHA